MADKIGARVKRSSSNPPTLANVQLLTMNANGPPEDERNPAVMRKHIIYDIFERHKPVIVLFQEYKLPRKTKGKPKYAIHDKYKYHGNKEASIMVDSEHVVVIDLPANDIDVILKKKVFPRGYDPKPRMCLKKMTFKTKPDSDFICISWHGVSTGYSDDERREYFKYLMTFLRFINKKYKSILVGGDFNIDMREIEDHVKPPFRLCVYEASRRRAKQGIVDFYIVSAAMVLEDVLSVNLEHAEYVYSPNTILDHDPVLATLKNSLEAKLLIMNAHYPSVTEMRKHAIFDIIVKHKPVIVLFQEFKFARIDSWNDEYCIRDNYFHMGNGEASIMYDRLHVDVKDLKANQIESVLSELQRTPNNRLNVSFPTDFDPIPRMCLRKVKFATKPALKLICISWHGIYKTNDTKKLEFFKYLMEFCYHLRKKFKRALLIGGDFNINIDTIETNVPTPFRLYKYGASDRRDGREIIDFYIVSAELALEDIHYVDLTNDTKVVCPNGIFDHDPVRAIIKPRRRSI